MSITHRRRLHPPSKLCACNRTDSARAPRSLAAFLLHAHSDGLPVQGARGAACGSGDIGGHTGTEHSDACPAPACSRSLLSSAHTHSAGDASCAGAALSRWAKRAGCTGAYVLRSCSRGKVPVKATGAMRGGCGASRSHGPGAPSSAPRYGMGNLPNDSIPRSALGSGTRSRPPSCVPRARERPGTAPCTACIRRAS
jgi:hypothetical protein